MLITILILYMSELIYIVQTPLFFWHKQGKETSLSDLIILRCFLLNNRYINYDSTPKLNTSQIGKVT